MIRRENFSVFESFLCIFYVFVARLNCKVSLSGVLDSGATSGQDSAGRRAGLLTYFATDTQGGTQHG
jgi:hypothetical protein